MDSTLETRQEQPVEAPSPVDPAITAVSALYSRASHLRIWSVMCIGLVIDLWTKHWAFSTLHETSKRCVLIPDVLSFHTSKNSGALFGMGQNLTVLFIVASVFALGFVLYIFSKSSPAQRSFHVGLGMVLGGALGNLFDRVFGGGEVRDFIKIDLAVGQFKLWPWIFNFADMLLVCGVGLLLLNIWFDRRLARETEREESANSA